MVCTFAHTVLIYDDGDDANFSEIPAKSVVARLPESPTSFFPRRCDYTSVCQPLRLTEKGV
ncbi:unnamed protein product [Chondrus crispus]|uniref:Uncharacterized protein n=1 Tax=Chondrus crispus TaxID=2769 RepID=R7Q888_CHOCR|nr:unnamed protein product [Chondrus crispus]CDF33700.1 unnamed protein product [Chondrus crispus]|eukprot:XP_005713519.1 unnamed protein product [Chondrus crispus]